MTLPPPAESGFKRRLRAGFTLLELSIVLVIIGLLIGGIFVGQSLIHNAQINAVITEFKLTKRRRRLSSSSIRLCRET